MRDKIRRLAALCMAALLQLGLRSSASAQPAPANTAARLRRGGDGRAGAPAAHRELRAHGLRPAALLRRRRQRHGRRQRRRRSGAAWRTRSARSICGTAGRAVPGALGVHVPVRRSVRHQLDRARARCRPAATCSTIRCPRCSRRSIRRRALGAVTIEDGDPVVQFTPDGGTAIWIAFDPATHLPAWTRRVVPHQNLGDVAVTSYFTGYAPVRGRAAAARPHEPHRLARPGHADVPGGFVSGRPPGRTSCPRSPRRRSATRAPLPPRPSRALGKGRVGRARGHERRPRDRVRRSPRDVRGQRRSPRATLARIDAANALVRGKQVTAVIVSHHHFDHTAGLRAAVSRGLSVISHRGNEGIIREMIERPAVVYPGRSREEPAPASVHARGRAPRVAGPNAAPRDLSRARSHAHGERRVRVLAGAADLMEGDLGDEAWTLALVGRRA